MTEGFKRQSSPRVVQRRQVEAALGDIREEFSGLQREAVFINAAIERGTPRQYFEPRLIALRASVCAARARLDQALASLPEELRTHGRVDDVQRALRSIEGVLPPTDA